MTPKHKRLVAGSILVLGLCGCSSRRTVAGMGDDAGVFDSGAASDAAPPTLDAAIPSLSCAAVQQRFGRGQRLSELHAEEVLISDDLRYAVLAGGVDQGPADRVEVIDLLDGSTFQARFDVLQRPALKWLQQGQYPQLVVRAGSPPRLSPLLLRGGPGAAIYAEGDCHYLIGPEDGRHILAVTDCHDGAGTLWHVDLLAGRRQLGERVDPASVAISSDGKLAFVARVREDGSGTLMVGKLEGDAGPVSSRPVVGDSVMFARPDLLLFRHDGPDELMAVQLTADASAGSIQTLATGLRFGHVSFTGGDAPYRVTPDGGELLAAAPGWAESPGTLYAVPTDGAGQRALADDVLLQIPVMSAVNPFPYLTADGSHAIYQQHVAGLTGSVPLAAVRLADGRQTALTPRSSLMTLAVAPANAAVAVVEQPAEPGGDDRLLHVDLRQGGEPLLLAAGRDIHAPRILPGNRGVLHLAYAEPDRQYQLAWCRLEDGGACQVLGRWSQSRLLGRYHVAPDGCFVVYHTDQGDEPGTHLAPIVQPEGRRDHREP